MMELHEIRLSPSDTQKLRQVCQQRSNMIRYKEALALIHFKKDQESEYKWKLSLPQQSRTKGITEGDDTRSVYSNMSVMTDVSLDPFIRKKAISILETHKGPSLEPIKEEDKLNSKNLKNLDSHSNLKSRKELKPQAKSQLSKVKSSRYFTNPPSAQKPTRDGGDLFESKTKFEELSNVDQDDAYGNYKPAFLIKS
mmetsp:Transcript_40277/g.61462  ORF Transcript_40277/g.61462 Transcript_40277/m.61462 type:complete len:196 (+) Transcript_40277:154-741(+)